MTFRITKTTAGTVTTLKIDGELTSEGVAELEKTCTSIDGLIDLDLSELMRVEAEGIQTLKNLRNGGARLVAVSPHIKLRLESEDT